MMVLLVDRILKLLDSTTDTAAVLATMIDWSNAFDRLDPTLAIQKFIKLGVRESLIPLLISYLQDRKMRVKFNGELTGEYGLVGGGPQGTLLGLIEYQVQSNDAADCIKNEDRFKYIDDLSILEKINLLCIGISSFNLKESVASDMVESGIFVSPDNLKTQEYLNKIAEWTTNMQMLLNKKKSKVMNFNFTKNYQFSSRLKLDNEVLETISETKLLGVMINDKLTWDSNTSYIVKRANGRMRMLHKLVDFNVPVEDLITIYILYIRSVLEQSCQVWHSRLTFENLTDLERVQKN